MAASIDKNAPKRKFRIPSTSEKTFWTSERGPGGRTRRKRAKVRWAVLPERGRTVSTKNAQLLIPKRKLDAEKGDAALGTSREGRSGRVDHVQ